MDLAARGGHLEMVQYLHLHRKEGCTPQALAEAAANGHLEVVKYLLSLEKPFKYDAAMAAAATMGSIPIIEILARFVDTKDCREAVEVAAKHNHMDVLQWFQQHKPKAIAKAKSRAHLHDNRHLVQMLTKLQECSLETLA
ncbi:unnamed protein product [Aphanomyces euteiches]